MFVKSHVVFALQEEQHRKDQQDQMIVDIWTMEWYELLDAVLLPSEDVIQDEHVHAQCGHMARPALRPLTVLRCPQQLLEMPSMLESS